MFHISTVGIGIWSFWTLLLKEPYKIGCKMESCTLQGLSKDHIWCKPRNPSLKGSQFRCKKIHFIWVSSHHPFDDVSRVEVFINQLPHHYTFTNVVNSHSYFPMDGWCFFGWLIQRPMSYLSLYGWMFQNTYKTGPKQSHSLVVIWGRFWGEWCLGIQGWMMMLSSSLQEINNDMDILISPPPTTRTKKLTCHRISLIFLGSYLNLDLWQRSHLGKGFSLISMHTTTLCFSSTSKVADTFPTTTPFL